MLALHSDGVGSKVLVAEAARKYDTIGIDCVAMNVNDIICLGAEPIALTDYLALENPRPNVVKEIMKGLRRGAREANTPIIAGETAIIPDVVRGFDLSATAIGLVRKDRIITGEEAEPGDVVLGLRSSGIHSNGLTLARRILLTGHPSTHILSELLRPTRIYVKQINKILCSGLKLHGLAHITGGAYAKLKRIGLRADIGFALDNLPEPPSIFTLIQQQGHVPRREMYRTFNMGIGFLIICPKKITKHVKRLLPETLEIGRIASTNTVTVKVGTRTLEIESW